MTEIVLLRVIYYNKFFFFIIHLKALIPRHRNYEIKQIGFVITELIMTSVFSTININRSIILKLKRYISCDVCSVIFFCLRLCLSNYLKQRKMSSQCFFFFIVSSVSCRVSTDDMKNIAQLNLQLFIMAYFQIQTI